MKLPIAKAVSALLMGCMFLLAGCTAKQNLSPSQALITNFVQAFNHQDADAMLALSHPDIEWIYISGSGSTVASTGLDAMRQDLEGHFASPSKVTSSLSGWTENGDYLSTKETASWHDKDGNEKQQASIAVYQLKDNLVRRVWYYPEQK